MFVSLLLGAAGLLTACKDYLDKSPLSEIEEDDAYKDFTNFQGFTEEMYNCLPCITESNWHNCWNFGEDEYWEPNETRLFTYALDKGNYWAWNTSEYSWLKASGGDPSSTSRQDKGSLWQLSWYAIRKANIGIANLDKMTDCTSEEKDLVEGQLYFFRGFYHFMIMQFWGGLPYMDEALESDAVFDQARLNYQETAERVASDLSHAAELLPVDWDETVAGQTTLGNNKQRINKIMALCFLGKNLLYAGSPLMNEESTGSAEFNIDYCKRAADAFAQALQLCASSGMYELTDFDTSDMTTFKNEYSQLFYTYNQNGLLPGLKEAIFQESLAEATTRWRWNQVNDYRPPIIQSSGIKCYPPANYVNYFGMQNGLPLDDPNSGWSENYPWRNRDPRFYADIIYDGVRCVQDASNVSNDNYRTYASLYTDGKYRTENPTRAAATGYLNTKFVSQYSNQWDGYNDNNCMVLSLMRLSDVYLMYAEATYYGYGGQNATADGYSLTPIEAVNRIRERVGVTALTSAYRNDGEKFISELRRERAVELAFEGHRFNDLRRWKLLLTSPYTLKTAVYFDRDTSVSDASRYDNPSNAPVLNWTEEVLVERKFSSQHYWFPFLRDDVNMYEELEQNPGW